MKIETLYLSLTYNKIYKQFKKNKTMKNILFGGVENGTYNYYVADNDENCANAQTEEEVKQEFENTDQQFRFYDSRKDWADATS